MSLRKKLLLAAGAVLLALVLAAIFAGEHLSPQPEPEQSPAPTDFPAPQPSLSPSASAPPEATAGPRLYAGPFELPVQGATGYATVELNLRGGPSASSALKGTIPPGEGFRIVREEGGYWYVTSPDFSGYVAHRYCMINLPDVIPSIVYDNTNSYSAKLASSGEPLPGITGEGLYENACYNERLGQDEFIMPVLYEMALKIQSAQQAALAQGDSLKIYEAYRPYRVQRMAVSALDALAGQNPKVRAGISTPPWKVSWFVSQGISNHQRGCAIDVSLVKVERTERRVCGPYAYREVTGFTEYRMPTAIHELSIAAAAFSEPVSSVSDSAWRRAAPAKAMNEAAKKLQRYCTDAGLTPLASEWWHFNDLAAYGRVQGNPGRGEYTLTRLYSAAPEG